MGDGGDADDAERQGTHRHERRSDTGEVGYASNEGDGDTWSAWETRPRDTSQAETQATRR